MMPGCVCACACAGGSVNSPLVTTSAVYWQLDVPALTATTSVNPSPISAGAGWVWRRLT